MRIIVLAAALSLGTASALAQYSAPAQTAPDAGTKTPAAGTAQGKAGATAYSGPSNPAVKTTNENTESAAGPVAGANSFTESEARARLQSRGFTNVSGLSKDKNGIWRGRAQKGSQAVNVSLDYQGNVFTY